ncbi:MAG TPA: hypothetical protein VFY89_09080 [Ktedonobacterales bacterium]
MGTVGYAPPARQRGLVVLGAPVAVLVVLAAVLGVLAAVLVVRVVALVALVVALVVLAAGGVRVAAEIAAETAETATGVVPLPRGKWAARAPLSRRSRPGQLPFRRASW